MLKAGIASQIDYAQISIVGEYTTAAGPYQDDHFLTIIYHSGENFDIPAHEATEVLIRLEGITSKVLSFALSNVGGPASRIMFPPTLLGHPLLEFDLPKATVGKLFRWLRFGLDPVRSKFTDEVKTYISRQAGEH